MCMLQTENSGIPVDDPFGEACTIAQACSKVWRKNHMSEDCIAIVPPERYPNQKNYSIKAVRWIQSLAKKNGKWYMYFCIKSSIGNQGEVG